MILASSCSQEEISQQQITNSSVTEFIASFEQNDSRTYLEDGKYLRWTADDELSIFMGTTLNRQFRFTGETGDNSGGFEEASSPGFVTGNNLDNPCHYAVYPYNKKTKISETGILTINLPSQQTYAANSFGLGDNTMVAVTSSLSDMNLAFKNACGYLKLKFYGNDVTVKSIVLQSNGGEKLSGTATLTAAYGKHPSVSMSATASDMITLDCGETGVKIGSTKEEATEFWFVVPETSFSQGFTLTVTSTNGNSFVKTTSKNIAVERNVIKPISAMEVVIEDTTPYVTFKAEEIQILTISKTIETLEYSLRKGPWQPLVKIQQVSFGGVYGDLQIRGKSPIGTGTDINNSATLAFLNDVDVSCSGDIRTLVNYECYETVNTSTARFMELFKGCTNLIQGPELPANILAEYCYKNMFYGCTSLKQAPELPAKTLAESCYSGMFYGCTSLKQAPELPAETLAESCYSAMFSNCTNLTQAPVSLPAKILANDCYRSMFYNCSNLTQTPVLSAEVLTYNCYSYMFYGCKKVNRITMLATDINATSCLGTWVKNVATKGTFIKNKAMTSLPTGSSGIPAGWTVENY